MNTEQEDFDAEDDESPSSQEREPVKALTETPEQSASKAGGTDDPAPIEYAQITKAELDSLRASAARIDEIRATQDKSFGKFGETIREIKARLDAGKPVLKMSDEQIAALREFMPEFGDMADQLRVLKPPEPADGAGEEARAKLFEEFEAKRQAFEHKTSERLLRARHKDWQTLGTSKEFADFVQSKGSDYVAKMASASQAWDDEVIGDALDDFKAATAKAAAANTSDAATRRSRMSAAITPRASGQQRISGYDERSDFNSA